MPLRELIHHMRERIEVEYEDAANSVGYESAEGGYQLPTMDGYDLLDEVGVGDLEKQDLLDDLAAAFSDPAWVHKDPYSLTEEEARRVGWEEFSDIVKHRVRYLMFPPQSHADPEISDPSKVLDELGDLFHAHGLVTTLKAGTELFRVRIHAPGGAPPITLSAFGPPPEQAARFPNRMSPAGVSMLYVAMDRETALAETYVRQDGDPAEATIVKFVLKEDLTVLDLVNLPPVPSIFDSDDANLYRASLHFLHGFTSDLTQPVEKDGREHIEFVPPQIVTEYVRYRLPERLGKPIHGILYGSSRRKGGLGCVLFFAHEDLMDDGAGPAVKAPFDLLADQTETVPLNTTKAS